MKQLILSLLLAVCTVCTAQTNHMKFKGIPMDGTLESFTSKLEAKGFTSIGIQDGISILNGEFASYKDCTIAVMSDNSGMICKVCVMFPKMDQWKELGKCYDGMKKMLTDKYGSPTKCEEKFFEGYDEEGSNKVYAIQFDKYKYYSEFSSEEGDIVLEICHNSLSCFVTLSYLDNINQEKLRKQIMDDL